MQIYIELTIMGEQNHRLKDLIKLKWIHLKWK